MPSRPLYGQDPKILFPPNSRRVAPWIPFLRSLPFFHDLGTPLLSLIQANRTQPRDSNTFGSFFGKNKAEKKRLSVRRPRSPTEPLYGFGQRRTKYRTESIFEVGSLEPNRLPSLPSNYRLPFLLFPSSSLPSLASTRQTTFDRS